MFTKVLTSAGLCLSLLGLAGCQSGGSTIHYNNQSITLKKSPEKMVVMDFGAVDTLDALGVGNRIIAVPQANIPDYLSEYHADKFVNTGGLKAPDIEKIAKNQPDLIISNGRQAKSYDELAQIAPVLTLVIDTSNFFGSIENNIKTLATITGKEKQAQQHLERIKKQIDDVQRANQAKPVKATVALHNNGKVMLMNNNGYAALIHDTLRLNRATPFSVTQKTQSPVAIDNQYITTYRPDIIFIIDRSKAIGDTPLDMHYFDAKLLNESGTKIVTLTADLWYLSGGGIESLSRQISEVAAAIQE